MVWQDCLMILLNMEICCKNVANIKNFANGAVAKNISISKIATVLLNRAGRKYLEEKLSYLDAAMQF